MTFPKRVTQRNLNIFCANGLRPSARVPSASPTASSESDEASARPDSGDADDMEDTPLRTIPLVRRVVTACVHGGVRLRGLK